VAARVRFLAAALLLVGCASADLRHGQSGNYHVFLGAWPRVQEACRAIGVTGEGVIFGCWLKAGDTHWIWASEDTQLADTLAHEIRHTHEGLFHP
jgi:hypothetical protein